MPSVEIDQEALKAALEENEDVKAALAEAAESIAEAVRSGTTGHLVESIQVVELETGHRVFSDAYVMIYYEFGTGMRFTKYGASRGEMPAFHPFLHAAEGSGLRYDPGAEGA